MQLMDMMGRICGNSSEGAPPDGYWHRADDAPDFMPAIEFLDRIGPVRFAAVFAAMNASPQIAFQVFRGLAAQNVHLTESFPALVAMEQAGILPAGTAVEVWS